MADTGQPESELGDVAAEDQVLVRQCGLDAPPCGGPADARPRRQIADAHPPVLGQQPQQTAHVPVVEPAGRPGGAGVGTAETAPLGGLESPQLPLAALDEGSRHELAPRGEHAGDLRHALQQEVRQRRQTAREHGEEQVPTTGHVLDAADPRIAGERRSRPHDLVGGAVHLDERDLAPLAAARVGRQPRRAVGGEACPASRGSGGVDAEHLADLRPRSARSELHGMQHRQIELVRSFRIVQHGAHHVPFPEAGTGRVATPAPSAHSRSLGALERRPVQPSPRSIAATTTRTTSKPAEPKRRRELLAATVGSVVESFDWNM
nr:hypothetical protein [Pseudonocardia nigra]